MPTGSDLSLWKIDETITELLSLREEVETEEERAAIDGQVREWVERELQKFDRCYGFIRYQEQQAAMAAEVQQKAGQWKHIHTARADRVREMVKQVMDHRGTRKIEGPGVGSFTVRPNGGKLALEITDPAIVPAEFQQVILQLPKPLWDMAQVALEHDRELLLALLLKSDRAIDERAVRAALEAGQEVPGARLRERGTCLVVR